MEYESIGDKEKILSIKEYLNMIRLYLSEIINDHKNQGEWKIQVTTIAINFFRSKDSEETLTMNTKSDNIETVMGNKTDEIIEELFESLLQIYQEGLEESITGSEFDFDSVNLLYYKLHKISLNRDKSYIDSPTWLKHKEATINPKNNDDTCFQYTLTVALNYQNIKNNPEIVSKIKPFLSI